MNAGQADRQVLRTPDLLRAALLLAVGSGLLLASSPPLMGYAPLAGLIWLRYPAVLAHLLGWFALAGFLTDFERRELESRRVWGLKVLIFLTILAAFLVGLALFRDFRQPMGFFAGFEALVILVLFPYSPVVYAPVVFVLAGLFLLSSQWLPTGSSRFLVWAGVVALVTTAIVGLLVQFTHPELVWSLAYLPGLTVIGFLLVAIGWWQASRWDLRAGPITLSENSN